MCIVRVFSNIKILPQMFASIPVVGMQLQSENILSLIRYFKAQKGPEYEKNNSKG